MCVPLVAALPAIIAGVGAAASTTGLVIQGVGAANAGAAAEEQGRQNERLARLAARDTIARGGQAAAAARGSATEVIGQQRVAYGSSGVDVGVGTAADAQTEARMVGELDAETIKNNAAREAWGLKTQGAQMLEQGKTLAAEGTAKAAGSFLGAGGTFLGGAADVYSKLPKGMTAPGPKLTPKAAVATDPRFNRVGGKR